MNDLFEKAPIPKAYFHLAFPVVLGMVASMIYNLADTFFVAQTGNADLVAGIALGSPLFSFMLAVGDILASVGVPLFQESLAVMIITKVHVSVAFVFTLRSRLA